MIKPIKDTPSYLIRYNIPSWDSIPEKYKNSNNKWFNIARVWFYDGFKSVDYRTKKDIDSKKAIKWIVYIIGSKEIKRERKIPIMAYLLSQWFEEFNYEKINRKNII